MNKYKLILFFLLVMVLHGGCASSKTIFDSPQMITGEIMVVGSEPFTKLVVRVEGGETYSISCSEEMRRSLLAHQGKVAEVFYDEIEKKSFGNEIRVTKVNFLFPKGS